MSDPVNAVNVPAALMNERTPSSRITSRGVEVSIAAAAEAEETKPSPGRVARELRKDRRFVSKGIIVGLQNLFVVVKIDSGIGRIPEEPGQAAV
jgi:hypothetical protein